MSSHKGIERDKTMADKFMYIPNYDTQNYLFCRLQIEVETFEHSTIRSIQSNSISAPTGVEPKNKKTLFKNFGD